MNVLQKRGTVFLVALLMLLGIILPAGSAIAAPIGQDDLNSSVPGPLDDTDEIVKEVKEKIKKAGGGKIVGTYETEFRPAGEEPAPGDPEPDFSTAAFPTGCSIKGVIYFTKRTTTRSSVYNDGRTYCVGATNIRMDLEIIKQDTVFGTLSSVAFNRSYGNGPELNSEAEYRCPTGNTSGFKGVADGILTKSGTAWVAYQETSGYTRYSCG